jgi:nucleoside-diphosphate-sugar epimerase
MISKIDAVQNGDTVEFWGTGKPLRQHLYVKDLAKIIPILLKKHNSDVPVIVAPDENVSIDDAVKKFINIVKKDVKVFYNNRLDGQYRKDGSNKMLKALIKELKFTSLDEGLRQTYEWYKNENSIC